MLKNPEEFTLRERQLQRRIDRMQNRIKAELERRYNAKQFSTYSISSTQGSTLHKTSSKGIFLLGAFSEIIIESYRDGQLNRSALRQRDIRHASLVLPFSTSTLLEFQRGIGVAIIPQQGAVPETENRCGTLNLMPTSDSTWILDIKGAIR